MFVTILVDSDHIVANVLTDCRANTIPAKDNNRTKEVRDAKKETHKKITILLTI